ncbi:MAG: hypothetical protein ACO1N9_06240 [Flavobacterium sp.]
MQNKFFYILLLFACTIAGAQRVSFSGKVLSGAMPVEGVLIVNLTAEKEVRSAKDGTFTLQAQPGDVLAISDTRIKEYRMILTADMMAEQPYRVYVNLLQIQLDEVLVTGFNLATILGIPVGRAYTPAERSLRTAASMAPTFDKQMTGGFIPLDPLINAFSGRTKTLKKNLDREKKYTAMDALSAYYSDDALVTEFNIPSDYVQGFKFYLAEDQQFTNALKAGNAKTIGYLLGERALQYLSLLSEEKE